MLQMDRLSQGIMMMGDLRYPRPLQCQSLENTITSSWQCKTQDFSPSLLFQQGEFSLIFFGIPTRSEGEVVNEAYESSENVYEDVSTSAAKKKGKTDGGKKRKGPPKSKDKY